MFKRILCPVDFDAGSLDALRVARYLPSQEQATLYLLHVIPPTDPMVISAPIIAERSEEQAQAKLQEIAKNELTGVDHQLLLRLGHPAKEIINAEGEIKAELVVLGTHGRSGVSHLVLGSVAEKTVRESSCPVLTVGMRASHQARRQETKQAPAA